MAEKPKISAEDTLDLTKIYSVSDANNRWAEGYPQHPTELIINDQNTSLSGIYPGNGSYEALCLKRVLLDYEVTKFNEADAFAMVYLSNLKEVWLSPKVDVVAFLENLETYPKEAEHPKLTGKEIASAPAGTFNDTDNLYVLKAYSAGITPGTGEGTFSPYTTLTREQMATFIHRALMYVKNN